MEENYNWNLILKVAVPFSIIEGIIFYLGIADFWKWLLLIIGMVATGSIVYYKEKKRSSIFTAVAIVFLTALIVRSLIVSGFL